MTTIEKKAFILEVVNELNDIFPMKLTNASKKTWVDELSGYSEDRILKTKKMLIRNHKGFLYPADFHQAISAFPKEQSKEVDNIKPVPMPESFKDAFLKIKDNWEK